MKIQLTETVRPMNVYRAVVRAMREQRPLFVRYTRANGSHTSRTVEPYAITRNQQTGDRYVRATDWKTGESRTLRLDRIDAYGLGPAFGFKLLDETSVHMSPEDEDAYRMWSYEQQRAAQDHMFSHPELTGAK